MNAAFIFPVERPIPYVSSTAESDEAEYLDMVLGPMWQAYELTIEARVDFGCSDKLSGHPDTWEPGYGPEVDVMRVTCNGVDWCFDDLTVEEQDAVTALALETAGDDAREADYARGDAMADAYQDRGGWE